jgi:GntR family transcriptional regulator, transcriptional repressor for pyruvate dehydrogenase complex
MGTRSSLQKRGGNLAEKLVGQLSADIRSGRLRPGEKLPTEAQVVERFSVSRTVVREALSRLQASGLVETRHGVGTFVSARRRELGLQADAAEIATVVDLLAMLELRIGVESEAAALAAQRRTQPQVAAMRQALADFEAALARDEDTVEADFRFHTLVAEASDNRYFTSVMASFGVKAIPRAGLKMPRMSAEERVDYLARVNREHEDIFSAIVRGDADGARAAMRNHIGNGRERLKARREQSDNNGNHPRRKP